MKVSELKGTYACTATVVEGATIEDRQAIIDHISAQVIAQGGSPYVEGNELRIKESGQYFRLPTMPKVRQGVLQVRSKDCVLSFDGRKSYLPKPKAADMLPNGFRMQYPWGTVEYTVNQ